MIYTSIERSDSIMTNLFAEHRKRAGLTQKQVGDYIGISPQAVSKWENGQTEPDIDTLYKLATLYNVTVDELVDKKTESESGEIKESDVPKKSSFKDWLKNKKKQVIIAASIILAAVVAVIVFAIIGAAGKTPEAMLKKYEKIELGMTMSEVKKILGKADEKDDKYFDEEEEFSIAASIITHGYYNADFWYYRGSGYEENVKAIEEFKWDQEFKPYYQIRITFNSDGEVIETYYNAEIDSLLMFDDYGTSDKTVTTVEYLDGEDTADEDKEMVKIYFDDGSVYLGEVKIVSTKGDKTMEHPWGDIEID